MKLVWAQFALSDRDDIFTFIETESPRAAAHIDDQIVSAVRRLLDFPESGRPGRVVGTRELVIPRTSYVVAYTVTVNTIRILRILHSAQMWPDELPLE
ncbi:type II toxin-antitoxin system mRNA interferase toxin, RelE/StbE family [Phyllobacterium sp. UNC302MFCol5.2]|uniref:type II toxin-antitoxin system RelE/ParE family toxin n=1 Tax=Phyllobacterium sp. UNC302MFCol5.2 TaxID=1449065 RepID=UPI000482FF9F|nr:type II toxin-antitoxin system mRNA interferase toxin, RelE/StbE family [Phyllobacterium sp. UNC302MFCol5.2]